MLKFTTWITQFTYVYVKKGLAKHQFKVMATWKDNPMFRWNNLNEMTMWNLEKEVIWCGYDVGCKGY